MALGTVNVPTRTTHTHTTADVTDFTTAVETIAAEQVAATEPKAHTHTTADVTDFTTQVTTLIGSTAPASHTQAASTITAGTLAGAVVAADDTAYTTYKLRNAALVSSKPSSIVNGRLAHVYS